MTTNFFHPSLLLQFLDLGSGMDKNQDPGPGMFVQGRCFPDQCVPDRKFLDVAPLVLFVPWINHPWPMCPVPGSHEGTGHNPVASDASLHPGRPSLRSLCLFDRLVPLRQCKLGPHIITPSYRFAPLGDTPMSLRSKYFSGWLGQGQNNQGMLCPWGATSKNFWSGTHRSGTN